MSLFVIIGDILTFAYKCVLRKKKLKKIGCLSTFKYYTCIISSEQL